jgi:hypothetical protein
LRVRHSGKGKRRRGVVDKMAEEKSFVAFPPVRAR